VLLQVHVSTALSPHQEVQAVTDDKHFNKSEQWAAVYAGNEEPIFDVEFTVFNQEPDDSTTMCNSAVFNA
jgi:hypothetical protein